MAELELTEKQRGQIESLLEAIRQDPAVRKRLQAHPRRVFKEYGLADLLSSFGKLEIEVEEPQVGALAAQGTGHWDFGPHVDTQFPPPYPPRHIDQPHIDIMAISGNSNINVAPVLRLTISQTSSPDPE